MLYGYLHLDSRYLYKIDNKVMFTLISIALLAYSFYITTQSNQVLGKGSQKLSLRFSVDLQEDSTVPLSEITRMRDSPLGNKMLLYDANSKCVSLYDMLTGRLCTLIEPSDSLSDLILTRKRVKKRYSLVPSDLIVDNDGKQVSRKKLFEPFHNRLMSACFLNDTTIAPLVGRICISKT